MKDLFTGALGRLNNHGGSKIYTTPNTILVPPEYEIEIGEHGIFISCSLDGRLWLFEDRIIALKWNKEAGKMEYAASKSFSDETFVARGRDWILTDKSVIQITDNSPYIFHETHNENVTPMEHFYSLLPALDGFQIVKNYLIRKPNEDYENLLYAISMPDIYLTFYENTIYARNNLGIGTVNISNHEENYSLNFNYSHNFSDNSWQNMGIAFIGEKIYGFKNKENNKGLCLCSENNQLYSIENSSWFSVSDNEGNIFFDPFKRSGIMIDNKGINILASEKSIECKGLSQWIAPAKQIQSIDDNILISSVNNSVLATYINLGFYRGLLPQKVLPLTTQAYKNNNNSLRLSLGIKNNNIIDINNIAFISDKINISIKLINVFEMHDIKEFLLVVKEENGDYIYYPFFIKERERIYHITEDFETDSFYTMYPIFDMHNIEYRIKEIYIDVIDQYVPSELITPFKEGRSYSYNNYIYYINWKSSGNFFGHYEKSYYLEKTIISYFSINADTGKPIIYNDYTIKHNAIVSDNGEVYKTEYASFYIDDNNYFVAQCADFIQIWPYHSEKHNDTIKIKYLSNDITDWKSFDINNIEKGIAISSVSLNNIQFTKKNNDLISTEIFTIDDRYKDFFNKEPFEIGIYNYTNGNNEFLHVITYTLHEDNNPCNYLLTFFIFRSKFI